MEFYLLSLFEECLAKEYTHLPGDVSYAADRRGDALYLWFEHSNGARDWLNNLDFAAVPYREMSPPWKCHGGFLRAWERLRPVLSPMIQDPTVKKVCLVGYSHGAALATLCHEFVWFHRPDLRQTLCGYGFGAPRVLHGCVPPAVAMRWNHFYVIRNQDDLVTHLPPRASGYCHVGNLVTVGQKGRYSPIDAHRPESYKAELSGGTFREKFPL